jgi:hypothetical protein
MDNNVYVTQALAFRGYSSTFSIVTPDAANAANRLSAMSRMKAITRHNLLSILTRVMKCACCGGTMLNDKDIGNSVVYRCVDCGLSNTKLKEEKEN